MATAVETSSPPPVLPLEYAPPPTFSAALKPLLPTVLAIAVFAAFSLWAAVASEGFLEADSCTHYLYARFALAEPHYLVNVWGRPLCTTLYAVPAHLAGLMGVRVTSLLLAVGCGLVAMRLARLQRYRLPVLALVFTLAQPLVFFHSFSELTELPFALLIVLAFWAYRVREWLVMAFLVGLSPLGRPEGFGFIAMAIVALVMHRKWYWLPVLAMPLIGWNHAGWELFGRPGPWWRWLPENWPYAAESLYESGHLLHFVGLLPVIVGPLLLPATCLGVWRSLIVADWRPRMWLRWDHVARCQVLVAVIPLLILVGHSLLYWLGKMASNGEARYLLVVAPFWGLLSARGWEWAWERLEWRRPVVWAGVLAILPVATHLYYQVLPLKLAADWIQAKAVAQWYADSGVQDDYPYLLASHPGVFYFLDVSPTGKAAREWHRRTIEEAPPGTLLAWDSVYGVYNSDAARSVDRDAIRAAGWVYVGRIMDPDGAGNEWSLFRSPADKDGTVREPNGADATKSLFWYYQSLSKPRPGE